MKRLLTLLLCLIPICSEATKSNITLADTAVVAAGKVLQVTGRVQADSIFSGAKVVTPIFSSAWTAGKRVRGNLFDLDTLRVVDSLTVAAGSKTRFLPGSIFQAANIQPDTLGSSWLMVAGKRLTAPYADLDTLAGGTVSTGIFNIGTATNWQLGGTAFTGTMAKVNAVTDGSVLTTQHYHSALSASDGSPNPAVSVDSSGAVFLSFLDTTLALSGKRIIVGSLHDPAFNCVNATPVGDHFECGGSFEKFRELEKSTSIHNAATRGGAAPNDSLNLQPSEFSMQITTAGDSLVFLDRTTGKIWWALISAAANACSSGTFNDAVWLDGRVHVATSKGKCELDFQADAAYMVTTAGTWKYLGTLNQRNAGMHQVLLSASPAIVNNTVNSVSAIRDPGGKRDALGRLAQWFDVGTGAAGASSGAGDSWYNPYTNAFTTSTNAICWAKTKTLSGGGWVGLSNVATLSVVGWKMSGLGNAAGWNSIEQFWRNSRTGSERLAWSGSNQIYSGLAVIERASWAGTEAPLILVGADSGFVALHAKANDNTNGGQQLIESTFNSGYMGGAVNFLLPLESGATDISPNAVPVVTGGGAHTYVNGVIGKADSMTASGAWKSFGPAGNPLRVGTGSWSFGGWYKRNVLSAGAGPYMELFSRANLDDYYFYIYANGNWQFDISDDYGATVDRLNTPAGIFNDTNWHFIVAQVEVNGSVTTGGTQRVFFDGELVASQALTNVNTSFDADSLSVGAYGTGGTLATFLAATMDNPFLVKKAYTPTEIRYMYQQGLSAMQHSVSVADALPIRTDSTGYVQALPTGVFVAGNQDSLTIFNRYGIPVQRLGSPGGLIKDVALYEYGADSLGIYVVTSTKTQLIQPDVLQMNLAQVDHPFVQPGIQEPVVVDSSGKSGLFWTLNDAAAAAKNMHMGSIFIAAGTQPVSQILSQDSLRVDGAGPKTIFDGGNTSIGLLVSGTYNTISNISAKTTAGGSGGFDAFSVTGTDNSFQNIFSPGADDDCFNITGPRTNIFNSFLMTCDDDGAVFDATSDNSMFIGNRTLNTGGQGVQIDANGDNVLMVGNRMDGAASVSGTADSLAANHNVAY